MGSSRLHHSPSRDLGAASWTLRHVATASNSRPKQVSKTYVVAFRAPFIYPQSHHACRVCICGHLQI
ncbi:uncharacterized protein RCC_01621 [Ramularia collo-cygni]|uniref:Uncharacterized protein n=1 Tax=Ramularia collo-cygni TaxID=112498 RepID=A0A2D3UUT4_9PEZI|nr:uncharacterized protein RCC_01621 [Ramularia collo-cygni]CZT15787.1 uncharacterized protein RCC_01621 [Ramularia collo-cygni]